MKKVWQTKRKGIPGVYVGWYDHNNKRHEKYFSPKHKTLIRPFSVRKFASLNSDCRAPGEIIKVIWADFTKEYLDTKQGLASASLTSIKLTLEQFEKICQPFSTEQVTQNSIQKFINARLTGIELTNKETQEKETLAKVSPNTVNKDIRNLRALFKFGKEQFYIRPDLKIQKIKAPEKLKRVLSDIEIKNLLAACGDDRQWYMKILTAICTGLRRSDIEKLELRHFDLERKTLSIINKKTGKATDYQPLPDDYMPELNSFILEEIAVGQTKFFKIKFTKKWYTIKKRAGLEDIEFHDLRRTWGSMQAEAGVSLKTLQDGYKHSSITTTAQSYIVIGDTKKREGVNKLNVKAWL